MDFDHRDPATKVYGVSQMLTCSMAAIEDEMSKCDLVCANCHRIRTFDRGHHRIKRVIVEFDSQLSLSIEIDHDPAQLAGEGGGE